jgi:hypothetical protein
MFCALHATVLTFALALPADDPKKDPPKDKPAPAADAPKDPPKDKPPPDDPKKDAPKDKPATPPPAAEPPAPTHYKTVGDIEGVLVKYDASDSGGTVTIRIPQVALQGNGGGYQALGSRYGMRGPKLQAKNKEFDLQVTADAKIRIQHLPPVKDENGRTRSRTPDELRELKGPPNLPGYTAQAGDLQPDQVVRLHLVMPPKDKAAPPPEKKPEKKDQNEKDKNAPADPPAANLPSVSMIIILANSATPAQPKSGDAKKPSKQ